MGSRRHRDSGIDSLDLTDKNNGGSGTPNRQHESSPMRGNEPRTPDRGAHPNQASPSNMRSPAGSGGPSGSGGRGGGFQAFVSTSSSHCLPRIKRTRTDNPIQTPLTGSPSRPAGSGSNNISTTHQSPVSLDTQLCPRRRPLIRPTAPSRQLLSRSWQS